jgi:hypothetical protein
VRLLVTLHLDDDDNRPTGEISDDVQRQLAGDAADVDVIAATDDGVSPAPHPDQTAGDVELTAYLAAVITAMMRHDPDAIGYLSPMCPECGQLANAEDGQHVVLGAAVVVGCEGYWVIDPNTVGVSKPNWQPHP